jgi:hypothetical protein
MVVSEVAFMKSRVRNFSERLGDGFEEFIDYAICKLKNEFALYPRKNFFFVERDAMASFSPLRLGGSLILKLAPVKSDRRSSPEVTRSEAECS